MNRFKVILAFIIIIFVGVSCTPDTGSVPDNVDDFVAAYEANLEKFETAYKLKLWEFREYPTSDSLKIYRSVLKSFLADPRVTENIDQLRLSLKDEILDRKLDMIYARSLLEQIETEPDIAALKDSLQTIIYNADRACRDNDYIYDIGRDLLRSEYLIENNYGDMYGDAFLSLIRKRNIAARRYGYKSYYSLVLKMENLTTAYIDSVCEQLLMKTDSAFRAALGRASSPGERNPGLFSYRPGIRNFTPVSLEQSAQNRIIRETCKSIGFDIDKMPLYYFFADSGLTGPMEAFLIYIPDDIRIAAATFPSLGSLEGLMEHSGLALYAASIDQKDYLFRQPSTAVWTAAVRHIFGCLIFEPAFLKNYLGVEDQSLNNWRSFREYYSLVKLRYRLFCTMLEKELYTGSIPDFDKFYSELYNRVFFNMAPVEMKAHLVALYDAKYPIVTHSELLGLLVAGQVYRHMRTTNVEIVGNPATRHYLTQNCFRYGARYDWRELLKWATGEDLKYEYYIDFSD